jgi:hypothetical protein
VPVDVQEESPSIDPHRSLLQPLIAHVMSMSYFSSYLRARSLHDDSSLFTDFENFSVFKPAAQQEQSVDGMLDQVIAWGGALKSLRELSAVY